MREGECAVLSSMANISLSLSMIKDLMEKAADQPVPGSFLAPPKVV